MKTKIPGYIKKYFWETEADKINPKKKIDYIISRILEYGDLKANRWLFNRFRRETVKKVLLRRRGFSLRTANFWRIFFNVDKNKVLCLKRSYRKKLDNIWPY